MARYTVTDNNDEYKGRYSVGKLRGVSAQQFAEQQAFDERRRQEAEAQFKRDEESKRDDAKRK